MGLQTPAKLVYHIHNVTPKALIEIAARLLFLIVPAFSFVADPYLRFGERHHFAETQVKVGMASSSSSSSSSRNDSGYQLTTTLPQYLQQHGVEKDLNEIICQAAKACLKISQELAKFPITSLDSEALGGNINIQGEEQKPMDVVSNEIFVSSLINHVAAMASEEEEQIIQGNDQNPTGVSYEIAFDPLDGSSNLDVQIATGSIFGIAPYVDAQSAFKTSGRSLVAAGYSVYSSSLEFVLSLSSSVMSGSQKNDGQDTSEQAIASGFTLDPRLINYTNGDINGAECFILTKPNMKCPPKGSFYSLNDGREPDWPDGLQKWIYDAKRGLTPSGTTYSSRYVCSLCADVHRTFIKGGWAGNPRPHLRLLYEAAPLAHVAEACGARGSDGITNLLDIEPTDLHSRTSVFIGSIDDVKELESYGDVQQSAKTY